jgi:hypothetical protein
MLVVKMMVMIIEEEEKEDGADNLSLEWPKV